MTLTALDNFRKMMAGDRPERLPFDVPVTEPVADRILQHTGTRDPVVAFDTDFHQFWPTFTSDRSAWLDAYERVGFACPAGVDLDAFGIVHVRPPEESVGAAYHFREMLHPLSVVTQVDQLERLPWPDVNAPTCYAHLAGRVAHIHAAGKVAVGGLECTLFEHAWYLRGMEQLYLDMVEGNPVADWLLDWFTRRSVAVAEAYVRAGVDVIRLGDDVGSQHGMMMAVDFWRAHLRPRLARVVDAIRARPTHPVIFYHSDGDIRDILDDLVDLGVQVVNPVQPECMPLDDVIPRYQGRLAFWGLVGTQTTMPFGTPADVRGVVSDLVRRVRGGARIVAAPTHVLEPEVPWENIVAFVDAVRGTRV